MVPAPSAGIRVVGRYALHDEIAAGGMATVHLGRLLGPVGFSRTVAIKRLHAQFAKDPEFVSMFLDEARLAARVRHPNVIGTLDVVALSGELFLVMEYVQGESLARLMRAARDAGQTIPTPILSAIMVGALDGLHAAHEATNDLGEPLGLVHRDVSPHNILVGTDGISRVLDFGIAKAAGRVQTTRDGQLKGKISYMAPEQVHGTVDRRTDVYSASVVLWEGLAGRRLFFGDNEAKTLANVLAGKPERPSAFAPSIGPELDALVLRGLDVNPDARFATAREMARALQRAAAASPASDVGDWVAAVAGQSIASRAERVASIERSLPSGSPDSPFVIGAPTVRPGLAHAAAADGSVVIADFETRIGPTPLALTIRRRRMAVVVAAGTLALAGSAAALWTVARKPASPSAITLPESPGAPVAASPVPEETLDLPQPLPTPPMASVPAAASVAPAAHPPARGFAHPVAAPPPKRPAEFDHVMDSRK